MCPLVRMGWVCSVCCHGPCGKQENFPWADTTGGIESQCDLNSDIGMYLHVVVKVGSGGCCYNSVKSIQWLGHKKKSVLHQWLNISSLTLENAFILR